MMPWTVQFLLNLRLLTLDVSKTVAGEQWLNNYMKILNYKQLNDVEIFDSHIPFKFGDGRKVYAERRARIPARLEINNV